MTSPIPILTFFNNKGGVGTTSLLYHLAWLFADQGHRILVADLDPQSNLTADFLSLERLEALWSDEERPTTIHGALQPIVRGTGDIEEPMLEPIDDDLWLLPGDLQLSGIEDELSAHWPKCIDGRERSFRVISSFWRILQAGAKNIDAELIMIDIGPNLGSINRTALIAADRLVVPLAPDLFSLQALRSLGPTLRRWREEWSERRDRNPVPTLELPRGAVEPIGYIVLQHSMRLDRPFRAYQQGMARIPQAYRTHILDERGEMSEDVTVWNDPHALGLVKHYRSLMPLAQEAGKPIFHLKPADGLVGAHIKAASEVYHDFATLADAIKAQLPSFDG